MQSRRSGTVLLIVVVIVMLLSLAAYKYMLTMEVEHMTAAINGDRLQAQQSAQSARDLFALMLKKSRSEREALGGLEDNPALFAGNIEALEGGLQTSSTSQLIQTPPFGLVAYGLQREPLVSTSTTNSLQSNSTPQNVNGAANVTGDATLYPPTRYGAINESQKLHLLKVMRFELAEPGAGVASLMSLPGMDEATAEALLDWIDPDDEPRTNGAESEFYSTLTRPIAPRNALPPDIGELLFVKGVTPLRLFGIQTGLPTTAIGAGTGLIGTGQANPTQAVSYATQSSTATTGSGSFSVAEALPWSEYLTVYAAERNESYTGSPRIFLNGKDLAELHEKLSNALSKEWADFVVLYRQFGPRENDSNESESSQNSDSAETTINFDLEARFPIQSPLDLIGASVVIPADEEEQEETEEDGNAEDEDGEQREQVVESPFGSDVSLRNADLLELLDLVTTRTTKKLIGRVNVNLAPVEVLAALPGLSDDTVGSIVSAREGNKEMSTRYHPAWLLVEGLVDLETMRAILPHVTCGGDVYRAEIWGRSGQEKRSPMVHFETVLDGTGKRCHAVYYRELDAPRDEIKVLTAEEFSSLGIQAPTLGTATNGRSQF